MKDIHFTAYRDRSSFFDTMECDCDCDCDDDSIRDVVEVVESIEEATQVADDDDMKDLVEALSTLSISPPKPQCDDSSPHGEVTESTEEATQVAADDVEDLVQAFSQHLPLIDRVWLAKSIGYHREVQFDTSDVHFTKYRDAKREIQFDDECWDTGNVEVSRKSPSDDPFDDAVDQPKKAMLLPLMKDSEMEADGTQRKSADSMG